MNITKEGKENFLGEVKKVLDGELESASIEFEGRSQELIEWLTKELGDEKVHELFFLNAKTEKKNWPEQDADVITSTKVVRSENRFKA